MVQATCLYNGCLPCTDENNLVNQHQSGFLVQCSNHKGQTETDWHKLSSTDTTLTLYAWYPPFQVTLMRRYNKNILFLLPILYKAVKFSTLNCIPNPVHYPSSPAVTQSNSGIRKTISTGMWPKFVFPANTLQYISLNTAAGSFKALMATTPARDFHPSLGQLLRNAHNHTLSCSSVSPR